MAEDGVVSFPTTLTRGKERMRGLITLTKNKFAFNPDDSSLPPVKLEMDIKVIAAKYGFGKGKNEGKVWLLIQNSVDEQNYKFELRKPEEADVCRNHFETYGSKVPPDQAEREEIKRKEMEMEEIKRKEIERKITLLNNNDELRKLHEQLARRKVLTEDEFWVKRKNLLLGVACDAAMQQPGLQSALPSYLPQMFDGQTKHLQIPMETIQQVFSEKPVVVQEYLKKVPHKMDETEFWRKVFTAQRYRQKDMIKLGMQEASVDEQLKIFLEDDKIVAREVWKKIRKVDPAVDIFTDQADDYTHLPDHGIMEKEDVVLNRAEQALLYDLNRHASVVLEGRAIDSKLNIARKIAEAFESHKKAKEAIKVTDEQIDKERMEKLYRLAENDDLEVTSYLPYVPFPIKDARQFFVSQKVDSKGGPMKAVSYANKDIDVKQVCSHLEKEALTLKQQGLNNPIIKSDTAVKVITIVDQFASVKKGQRHDHLNKNVLDNLPQETKDKLLEHFMIIQELLWHFWASCPPTAKFDDNKVRKVKEEMTLRYKALQEMKAECQTDIKEQLSLLIQPMLGDLDMAFEHSAATKKPEQIT